jgi:hypothetical protein
MPPQGVQEIFHRCIVCATETRSTNDCWVSEQYHRNRCVTNNEALTAAIGRGSEHRAIADAVIPCDVGARQAA